MTIRTASWWFLRTLACIAAGAWACQAPAAAPSEVDLALFVPTSAAAPVTGETFNMKLVAVNRAPAQGDTTGTATAVEAIVDVSGDVRILSAGGTDWQCDPLESGRLRCRYAHALLAQTHTPDLTLNVPVLPANATGTMTVQIVADQHDPDPANNWEMLIDTGPAPYDFVDLVGAPLRDWVYSNVITVTGIEGPTPMRVIGQRVFVRVNDSLLGATNDAIMIRPGDRVQLQINAADLAFVTREVSINLGGVVDIWRVRAGPLGFRIYDLLGLPRPVPREVP